jgi:hypothetical protein
MVSRQWVRIGGVAGILAVILLVSAGFVTGNTLSGDSSAAQIADFLTSHRSGVLTQTVFDVAGSAFSLWYGATLARILHARDPHSPLGFLVLGAGAAMATIASFDGVTLTALEFLSKQGGLTDPALTRAFYDLQNGLIMPGLFGCVTAVFLVSVGAAAVGGIVAARWVGWLSLVLAALSVLSSVIGLTLANGGTSALGFFPAIGFAVIALITSIFMLREREAGVTPPPPNSARVAA